MWISSTESPLGLLDRVVHSAERLCEDELCCLRHRRKVNDLRLLYKICHRAGHSMHEYLHHFVATSNTRTSAALGELALMVLRCKTD